jgi:UDP-N-acetylmuramoyl-tripeptide--D-alanyl-D-alanine ligase
VPGLPLYEVDEPLAALAALAAFHRRRFTGPVIAITGQNGKTSTKEMVAAVMSTRWRTHKTRANLNNLVGVPLTVLEAPADTGAMVVEAGANLPGEIAQFREILKPDIAIVTSAGSGHLEGFGSVPGVIREKLSLTVGAPLAIVGTTPPDLAEGARGRAQRVIVAGTSDADVVPEQIAINRDGHPVITVDGHSFVLAARGAHQASNAMIAWAVARELDLNLSECAEALEHFILPGGRGELTQIGALTILNDSYNANPESFIAAIALAQAMRAGRRLIFVAGSMRELGSHAPRLHAEIAEQLAALRPEVLGLVGEFVPAFAPFLPRYEGEVLATDDAESLGPMLADRMRGDELIVLKGSRGVALERLLPFLVARATP